MHVVELIFTAFVRGVCHEVSSNWTVFGEVGNKVSFLPKILFKLALRVHYQLFIS